MKRPNECKNGFIQLLPLVAPLILTVESNAENGLMNRTGLMPSHYSLPHLRAFPLTVSNVCLFRRPNYMQSGQRFSNL